MRTIASRILDARNTVEGKIISVLLSVLLAAMCFNVAIFTNEAAADDVVAEDAADTTDIETVQAVSSVLEVEDAIGDIQVSTDDTSAADDDSYIAEDDEDLDGAGKDALISTMALSGDDAEEGDVDTQANEPIDCPFTMEKIADGEYKITGEGVFAGEFIYNDEKISWQSDALGYMAINKLILGEGITAIAPETFADSWVSRSLKEIVLPTTLTIIGAKAFRDGYLQKINLDHVTSVGAEAFMSNGNINYASTYGNGITELTIPASLTHIGEKAFYQMHGLTTLTIKEGVASIGNNAFEGCRTLNSVVLPYSLDTIGTEAFSGCNVLTTISMTGETVTEGTAHIASVTNIGVGALNGVNMSSLILESIDTIGNGKNSIVQSCPSLTNLTLNNVTSVRDYAFYWSPALAKVTMNDVDSVGMGAFLYDTALVEVALTNVKKIGDKAFYGYGSTWSTLKKVIIDGTDTIGTQAFAYNYYMQELSLDNIGTIGQQAFYYCGTLPSVTMGKVGVIGAYAFLSCAGLQSIDNLKNVDRIDGFAFYGCSNLKGLTIEDATKMGFNGNYGDVMARVEKILNGQFKLDATKGIVPLIEEEGWTDTAYNASENWERYDNGTQIMQQARWVDGTNDTVAEVKIDAYFTAQKQMDYVFVADLSASMAQLGNAKDQNSRFYDMQSKLLDMTGQLLGSEGYDCKIALVTFGGALSASNAGTSKTLWFTDDANAVKSHINGLEPLYENTDYGLGMQKALELVNANTERNTVVVFLSDGQPYTPAGVNPTSNELSGTTSAAAISNLNVPIFGVLHSPGDAHDQALDAMKAVCGENTVFESTDTDSFGKAMNEAFTAVYPTYTITIPIGDDFQNVQNVNVSVGSTRYDSDSRSIIWTISDGMPFTKHTLTFNETLKPDRVALTGTNNFLNTATGTTTLGTSVIDVNGKIRNIIRSTVLVRTNNPVVPTPTPDPDPEPTPVTPAAVVPGGPAPAPGVAAPAPAPAAPAGEVIADDETPMAQTPEGEEEEGEEEEIIDDENPLGTFDVKHCWTHWLMLMGILFTAAYGVVAIRRRSTFTKDLDDFEKSITGETAKKRGTVTVRTGSHQAI